MSPKLRAFIDFIWKKRTLYVLYGMLIAFAIIFLVLATPLHVFLPGYLDVRKRAVVMDCVMRIDSLERECNLRVAYLDNMTNILRDRIKANEIIPYDSAVSRIQDTLLSASERETRFAENYDRQERFGLNALENERNGRVAVVFIAPVKGKVVPRDYGDDVKPGVTRVELPGVVPVLAPSDGPVISLSFLMGEGYHWPYNIVRTTSPSTRTCAAQWSSWDNRSRRARSLATLEVQMRHRTAGSVWRFGTRESRLIRLR